MIIPVAIRDLECQPYLVVHCSHTITNGNALRMQVILQQQKNNREIIFISKIEEVYSAVYYLHLDRICCVCFACMR